MGNSAFSRTSVISALRIETQALNAEITEVRRERRVNSRHHSEPGSSFHLFWVSGALHCDLSRRAIDLLKIAGG